MSPSSWEIIQADCIEAMREMAEASVDAIVTDPPYGLEFMGKEWDKFAPQDTTARVLRRGGSLSGDKRTPHGRANVAGTLSRRSSFRCQKCGGWSGTFSEARKKRQRQCECDKPDLDYAGAAPAMLAFQAWSNAWAIEALRVLKPGGHLLAFGGTRTYHRLVVALEDAGFEIRDTIAWMYGTGFPKSKNLDGQWQGWGTALKPAFEPIVVARKPLSERTVAANVLEHGTGALNIDATRISHDDKSAAWVEKWSGHSGHPISEGYGRGDTFGGSPSGRWPANVALDDQAAAMLDEQSGDRPTSAPGSVRRKTPPVGSVALNDGLGVIDRTEIAYGDTGGASRFFYVAKASRKERGESNDHPTVKPVALMRWLVRLVTPPDGVVLDPFTGSGTTGVAAVLEGFSFIGLEREAGYALIAKRRITEAEEAEPQAAMFR